MAKEKGTKYDGEKPMLALVPPRAFEEIGKAMTYGAKKYGQHNYLGGISYIRLLSALLRHTMAFIRGEDNDSESGLSHLAHAGASVCMLIETVAMHPDLDDRFKSQAKVVKSEVVQTGASPVESYL